MTGPSGAAGAPPALTVVGIGASSGGLEACTALIRGLPDGNGMAFVLVQHLDPEADGLLAPLLAAHTAMPVLQAADGMPLERDHLYVTPPGTGLSVGDGRLHLLPPPDPHEGGLPFDALLRALARDYADRAVCIILSGAGSDGSLGLAAIKRAGGLVIVQDPAEAGFDGMPRSAIATGSVDLVLPVADIPDALATFAHPAAAAGTEFRDIIALIRTTTRHDFTLYKPGTLHRRIERRMQLSGVPDLSRFLRLLQHDADEVRRLASDLLINVTSFFRDPKVFARLEAEVIPALIRDHDPAQPLRLWIVGCSTGEETWSLLMLFVEQLSALGSPIRLQVFASDVDAEAVNRARAGRYPDTATPGISPARLARFFTRDGDGVRIGPELRSLVVFSVADLLADPPFSRMDFISCRNLLIYLQREAQDRVLSLFDFALREGGVLLLGAAETIGRREGRFEAIGKAERLYSRVGRGRPPGLHFAAAVGRPPLATPRLPTLPPPRSLAAVGQRMLLELFAPAAVLVNDRHECLYSMGPVDRFLRVPTGSVSQNVLDLARDGVRPALGAALRRGAGEAVPMAGAGPGSRLEIQVRAVENGGEATLMICFVERAPHPGPARPGIDPQVAELELELAALRLELESAGRSSAASVEEQKALNEEALSVSEEYQSTNEELVTSKEELQSLNEELTALNSQLGETLDRQRTTANDMQNVLYSTDVATLFLDRALNIRLFTPATRSLFKVIPGDIGRPLTDLVSLAADASLPADAEAVLANGLPREREIETGDGTWFTRRVLPYRTDDNGVEGVVITFTDITERKQAARALEAAKHEAELANAAKSRFLAAASHDLRQPLQTLTLLQGMLAKAVAGQPAERFVKRLDDTLAAMAAMLNTVLDINQIEAGVVRAEIATFPIGGLLDRLRDEFGEQARAQGLRWRVVPCSLLVRSDPALLEQILRNLVSNALKYTRRGGILLGCRRDGDTLRIEVHDTGIGIPADKLDTIFEEYSQLDNAARDRSKGLGLGLSIVRRLVDLVGHTVRVRSRPGGGSVFTVAVAIGREATTAPDGCAGPRPAPPEATDSRTGDILVVEDEPALLDMLQVFLSGEGHRVATAGDGAAALDLVAREGFRPDLLLSDYNLPGGLNGLQLAARLREGRTAPLPAAILTGDISAEALADIAGRDCVPLNKPVGLQALTAVLQQLLPPVPAPAERRPPAPDTGDVVFVIDDDAAIRQGLRELLQTGTRRVEDHGSAEAFLRAYRPGGRACVLIDANLPGLSGLDLLRRLRGAGDRVPAVMITGFGDVHVAVEAMKAGASDFIEKPVNPADLLAILDRALDQASESGKLSAWRAGAARALSGLTERQREVMAMVIAGQPSKNIAADLGISQRTVENHRAAIMERTGSKSLPALARLALAADWTASDGSFRAGAPGS